MVKVIQRTLFCGWAVCCLCSCWLFPPDLQKEKEDRFFAATGHYLLKIYEKEDRLGYIYDNGAFSKKVWGGRTVVSEPDQSITLTYMRENFAKVKMFLGDDFELGPHLQNIDRIDVYLENIQRHQLVDLQPMIEHMGKEDRPLLEQDFIVSMIKVTKFSVQAFQKIQGELGAEYHPYQLPMKIRGSIGAASGRGEEQVGYDVFIGYQLYNGSQWIQNFDEKPKVDIWILHPRNDDVINQVRTRVKGSIVNYHLLEEEYKNQLRLYLMSRDEYEDEWVLQSKVTIDTQGRFEGIVKLGDLEKGDGHRYSIAAFATYFDINREVNSRIAFLPFNKGQYIIYVIRRDEVK